MAVFDREASRYDAWFDSPEGQVLFQAEVEALPFPARIFGGVLMILTLCFAEPLPLLREAKRVLKPEGGVTPSAFRDGTNRMHL